MSTKAKFIILTTSILAGIGLALIFSQLPFLKELPTTIQIFLAGTTSTAVEGIPGALPALVIAFAIGISMVVTPCFRYIFGFEPSPLSITPTKLSLSNNNPSVFVPPASMEIIQCLFAIFP